MFPLSITKIASANYLFLPVFARLTAIKHNSFEFSLRVLTMSLIIGREPEVQLLSDLLDSDKAEFLVVYGRRRIGKTFLISEFFKTKGLYFELTGANKAPTKIQLENFISEYTDVFCQGKRDASVKNWFEAFELLRKKIEEKIAELAKGPAPETKIILFLDELPWLSTPKSLFLSALEYLWNRHLSRMKQVILIVCGSAASWMIKKIINSRGGLHGRATQQMHLKPFTLAQTKIYLESQNIYLSTKDLTDLYMAIGGVAKYLTYIPRGQSTSQIIHTLCFAPMAPLKEEFDRLYHSLFDQAEIYIKIIRLLAKAPYGISQGDLLEKAGLPSGGSSSEILTSLEQTGFIMKVPFFNKPQKSARYRLIDEYSLFYLHWIEKSETANLSSSDPLYWQKQQARPAFKTWSGFAFETLCLKHMSAIKNALGISGVITRESTYWDETCQIDALIERDDNAINLCEMKYTQEPLPMTAALANALQAKKSYFSSLTSGRKTLLNTLVTLYSPQKNTHFLASVDCVVLVESFLKN